MSIFFYCRVVRFFVHKMAFIWHMLLTSHQVLTTIVYIVFDVMLCMLYSMLCTGTCGCIFHSNTTRCEIQIKVHVYTVARINHSARFWRQIYSRLMGFLRHAVKSIATSIEAGNRVFLVNIRVRSQ